MSPTVLFRLGAACLLLGLFLHAARAGAESAPAPRPVPAVQTPPLSAEQEQTLARTAGELDALHKNLEKSLAELKAGKEISAQLLEQAELNAQAARLQMENLQLEHSSIGQELREHGESLAGLGDQLKQAQSQPAVAGQEQAQKARIEQLQSELVDRQARLEQAAQHFAYIGARLAQARGWLQLQQLWLEEVSALHQARTGQSEESRFKAEQDKYQGMAADLSRQFAAVRDDGSAESTEAVGKRHLLAVKIQDAEERARIAGRELRLRQIRGELEQLQRKTQETREIGGLQQLIKTAEKLQEEVLGIGKLLKEKLELTQRQREVAEKQAQAVPRNAPILNQEQKILQDLAAELQRQAETDADLLQKAGALLEQSRASLVEKNRDLLLAQRSLPSTPEEWGLLIAEAGELPVTVWQYLLYVPQFAARYVPEISLSRWFTVALLSLLEVGGFFWLWRVLARRVAALTGGGHAEHHFSRNSLLVGLRLLRFNLKGLALFGWLFMAVWVTGLPSEILWSLGIAGALWFGVKLPVNLAWLLLAAPDVPALYYSPRLYWQLRDLLWLTGIFTAITLFVHFLEFSSALRDLNDSLFMLFLSLLVFPSLNIRKLAIRRYGSQIKHRQWAFVLRLLSLLVPLSILVVGILGVVGYINLGWIVAAVLSRVLAVLTVWLIARGLLNDFVVALKNYALRRSRNYGLLWTQDLIPLLHKLARVGLALLAALLLLELNGWETDSEVVRGVLDYALFSIGQTRITVYGLLLSALVLAVVIWLGSWSRRITYRWIYAGINDLGVRHSLSVFTQYSVLLIGILVMLKVIGLDLTTLAVFAGALGVGVGFGLQNIANNFISGLLLLAERPLRTGDIVEIGGNGGEVTRLGMRSLTIRTWDNQELIIPNADIISSPFVNWTHSDNIMRTVLIIGVGYNSDPQAAQAIFEQALARHPEILKDPEYKVYFWEYADSAITFRVQYYTNLRDADRFRVKSDLLHALWRDLKQAGIEIPYPQRDVYIRAVPERPRPAPAGPAPAPDRQGRRDRETAWDELIGPGSRGERGEDGGSA